MHILKFQKKFLVNRSNADEGRRRVDFLLSLSRDFRFFSSFFFLLLLLLSLEVEDEDDDDELGDFDLLLLLLLPLLVGVGDDLRALPLHASVT